MTALDAFMADLLQSTALVYQKEIVIQDDNARLPVYHLHDDDGNGDDENNPQPNNEPGSSYRGSRSWHGYRTLSSPTLLLQSKQQDHACRRWNEPAVTSISLSPTMQNRGRGGGSQQQQQQQKPIHQVGRYGGDETRTAPFTWQRSASETRVGSSSGYHSNDSNGISNINSGKHYVNQSNSRIDPRGDHDHHNHHRSYDSNDKNFVFKAASSRDDHHNHAAGPMPSRWTKFKTENAERCLGLTRPTRQASFRNLYAFKSSLLPPLDPNRKSGVLALQDEQEDSSRSSSSASSAGITRVRTTMLAAHDDYDHHGDHDNHDKHHRDDDRSARRGGNKFMVSSPSTTTAPPDCYPISDDSDRSFESSSISSTASPSIAVLSKSVPMPPSYKSFSIPKPHRLQGRRSSST